MHITNLKLNNFRNYKNLEINLSPKCNVFYGKNGQGKTNILEAVIFLSSAKSFRTKKTKDLIKNDSKFFLMEADFKAENISNNIKIYYENIKKKIALNNIKSNKFFNLIGFLKIVDISPEDIYLIKGDTSTRRQFLDVNISSYDSDYFDLLRNYKKILKIRNKILKDNKIDKDNLDIWTDKLISFGSKIVYKRFYYLKNLEELTAKKVKILSSTEEEIKIKYSSFIKTEKDLDLKKIVKVYREKIEANYKKDIFYKNTSVGPHRDDVLFYLNDLKAASFSSEGQKRCIVLALKASVFDIIYEKSEQKPIILIDDALNDLDEERFVLFYNLIKEKNQIFISTTKPERIKELVKKGSFFKVEKGKITKRIDI